MEPHCLQKKRQKAEASKAPDATANDKAKSKGKPKSKESDDEEEEESGDSSESEEHEEDDEAEASGNEESSEPRQRTAATGGTKNILHNGEYGWTYLDHDAISRLEHMISGNCCKPLLNQY